MHRAGTSGRPAYCTGTALRASPSRRADRWAADIADAVEKLRHHGPDSLPTAAKEAAAGEGTDLAKTGSLTNAHWIQAAVVAKAEGAPAGKAAAFETKHATDQDGEIAWLVRVAAAYKSIPEQRTRAVLRSSLEHSA
ncbi:DUF6545 domain-containing protein [Streptomyces sp. NPDC096339]|uniref:DUF6545 domain-containing protein n=1 Tax=Streptomyces sp. NPDC096339 TaxID=3366086 RepID=UPI0037FDEA05